MSGPKNNTCIYLSDELANIHCILYSLMIILCAIIQEFKKEKVKKKTKVSPNQFLISFMSLPNSDPNTAAAAYHTAYCQVFDRQMKKL